MGYQPTLADEMGELQERITSTRGHSITSLQAIYIPADDITDPAPPKLGHGITETGFTAMGVTDAGLASDRCHRGAPRR